MLQCPYCLKQGEPKSETQGNTTFYVCQQEQCQQRLARDYVESSLPRTAIGIIGFSGHGKTVFLHSLFYVLSLMENEWPGYHSKSLDDETDEIIHTMVRRLQVEALLPDSSPANFPRPALLLHNNIPGYGNWFVTMYDTAGAVFEDVQSITEQGRYVAHAETVFFLVSLADLGDNPGDRLKFLLGKYLRAVQDHMRVDLKKQQNLVVVFTKADFLRNGENALTEELDTYLCTGTYLDYNSLEKEGKARLQETSHKIETWLKKRSCQGFLSMARENFRDVSLTMVSATGAAPVGQSLGAAISPQGPKRMLDPLLWALEYAQAREQQLLHPKMRRWALVLGGVVAVVVALLLIQNFRDRGKNDPPPIVTPISVGSSEPTGTTVPESASLVAKEALKIGTDLTIEINKYPQLERVLHEAQGLQKISPRYQEEVSIAESTLNAAQEKKRQHLQAYCDKLKQLRRYAQPEIDEVFKAIKKSNLSKQQMIVADLMTKHLAALVENGVPKLDDWLLDFEQNISRELQSNSDQNFNKQQRKVAS